MDKVKPKLLILQPLYDALNISPASAVGHAEVYFLFCITSRLFNQTSLLEEQGPIPLAILINSVLCLQFCSQTCIHVVLVLFRMSCGNNGDEVANIRM